MEPAKVLPLPLKGRTAEDCRGLDSFENVVGDSRAIAVAKFRELADKLESGELDGARVQWRRCSSEELSGETELVVVTVQADSAYRAGTVQMVTTKIEEG